MERRECHGVPPARLSFFLTILTPERTVGFAFAGIGLEGAVNRKPEDSMFEEGNKEGLVTGLGRGGSAEGSAGGGFEGRDGCVGNEDVGCSEFEALPASI